MNEHIESFVIRGDYNNATPYFYGDLVKYDGSSFLALKSGKLDVPTDDVKSWYRMNSLTKFYKSDIKPKFGEQGDKWLDSTSGTMYTRIKQKNGVMFWVEF